MDSTKRRIDKELGQFVRKCYECSGKTIEDLAWELDIEPRTLNYYFVGARKPSQRTLLKLIRVSNMCSKDIPF